MSTEELEGLIADLFPGAGYCIAPEVLVKPGLPRRVEIQVHVWLGDRTLIHRAATNEEIWARLQQDLRVAPSRIVIGTFSKTA